MLLMIPFFFPHKENPQDLEQAFTKGAFELGPFVGMKSVTRLNRINGNSNIETNRLEFFYNIYNPGKDQNQLEQLMNATPYAPMTHITPIPLTKQAS